MKKSIIAFVSLIVLALGMCGCGKKLDSDKVTQDMPDNGVMCDIYYPMEDEVVKADEPYQIKKLDSLSTEVEEVMNALIPYLDSEMLTFQTYMVDSDNVINLTFVMNGNLTNEYFVLAKSSIVQTFSNIEGVTSIHFIWQNSKGEEVSTETLDKNSFCYE